MPSAKATRQGNEAGPQGASGSRPAQPAGQSLKQLGKRSKKNKAKKAAKKKKKMRLPTRLTRLLNYKAKRVHLDGLKSQSVNQKLCEGSTTLIRHCNRTLSSTTSGGGVKGFLEEGRGSCLSAFQKASNFAHRASDSSGDLGSKDGEGSAGWRLIPKEKLIALDCEMVGVGPQGRTSALGRCSIVDYDCNVLYDDYVKPEVEILHYRTQWSGIRKRHMVDAIPFREAQQQIADILRGKVLIGHSLRSDIQVLQLGHPREDTRDTSTYRGLRELAGVTVGPGQQLGLKKLTKLLFGHSIQQGEHCSVEDARATMNLYKLVERQWEAERVSAFPDRDFRVSFMDDHFWPDDLDQ
ncbi:apoptosis-enhancing nuclease-like [Patiria miniata]|uniref:RNA exonuclease 4 n=1 Tax=Patiria miniata TaxID=46514 RepID=A0A914BPV0_PATMI|nr:apoptosis-enhancing nuclease-like [Patiria miniata]XP_038078170.1 apoptosis-enhancing nuclease-like [Patiria miniata]